MKVTIEKNGKKYNWNCKKCMFNIGCLLISIVTLIAYSYMFYSVLDKLFS
jgi:hypothetical protein